MLIDSHCHLGHKQFGTDLRDVIGRAVEAGVTQVVTPAVDLPNARQLLDLAKVYPEIHPAVGIHPCDVDTVSGDTWINDLRALAGEPDVAAIGEIGLDYFHAPPEGFDVASWKQHQAEVLRLQLDLAVELGLNVILHARESQEDLVAAVKPYNGRLRGVFHCFTGTRDQAMEVIDMGHFVSFTGIVTFKNSLQIQETSKAVPADAFMVETDSPYLAPVPHRGKRCEPAFVADTARYIAALRGVSLEELAATTSATAHGFFRGLK
ncbi:MAG: TatD DNase family protein [Verrucomicrobiaceae bacterium]|nr:TatD DNase family protein [Verrucomicrobiaceae bacterium]